MSPDTAAPLGRIGWTIAPRASEGAALMMQGPEGMEPAVYLAPPGPPMGWVGPMPASIARAALAGLALPTSPPADPLVVFHAALRTPGADPAGPAVQDALKAAIAALDHGHGADWSELLPGLLGEPGGAGEAALNVAFDRGTMYEPVLGRLKVT